MAGNLTLYQFWKDFNLGDVQRELDAAATELAARQDESELSRKRLVDQSRDFKKNTPDEVRKQVAPLLKSFQQEVDNLSKRCKAAEISFLAIYKKLLEAPDPVPQLEVVNQLQKKAVRLNELELENKQLRDTLEEYNQEFASIKNQEVTIKQLREKIKEHEERAEATAQGRVKEKERELQRQFIEKERHLQQAQMLMEKKLGDAEHRLVTLQNALDSANSELFELKSKYDETSLAKSDEMEMVLADLEKANERCAAAERETERLRQQLTAVSSDHAADRVSRQSVNVEQSIDILRSSSLEVELAAKEREVAQLIDDIQRLQNSLSRLRDTTSSQIAKLEAELLSKSSALVSLEEKIRTQADYDEIRHELNILKSIEFAGVPVEAVGGANSRPESLETLLMSKCRVMQTENVQLKKSNADLNAQYSRIMEQYNDAFATVQEQKLLIAQLEEDLGSVNALSSMFRGDAEGEAGPPSQSAEFVADAVRDFNVLGKLLANPSGDSSKTVSDSLLPIIQSQRERFRLRAQELEAVSTSQQKEKVLLQNEIDKLRSDNVKLYEKIKFLQNFKDGANRDDTESRYSSQYEEKLDPFSNFSRQERMRRYTNLKPYEKITLSIGRFVMDNKMARLVTFCYVLLLHILVFLVLYKLAFVASCKRELAVDCHEQFAEHMAKIHGDKDFHAG